MFNVRYIGFLVLFTLLACSDNHRTRSHIPYTPRTGGIHGPSMGGGMGAPSGVAVLISNTGAVGVTQMTMNIFGTQGRSATVYSGPAQFNGSMTFSQNYRNAAPPSYPGGYNNPHSSYHGSYHSTSTAQQCPQGQVQFNCQGRLLNSTFTCQAQLYGGSYRIHGMLGQKQNTSQDYEIQSVQVEGPCTRPQLPGYNF